MHFHDEFVTWLLLDAAPECRLLVIIKTPVLGIYQDREALEAGLPADLFAQYVGESFNEHVQGQWYIADPRGREL